MGKQGTRRGFLKGIGAGVAAGGLSGTPLASRAQAEEAEKAASALPEVHHHPRLEIDLGGPQEGAGWSRVSKGLHGSFGSKDLAYFKHEVPSSGLRPSQELTAWRGERVTALIVLHTRSGAEQVRLQWKPLRGGGAVISPEQIKARFARYVLTNLPYGSAEGNCDPMDLSEGWLMPDVLDPVKRFDLPSESTRPVWLSIDVPSDASPGRYRTEIEVLTRQGEAVRLPLELEVQEPVLPSPSDWKFCLDLWQNPWAVAFYHGVEPWSPAHIEILKPHLEMLADAGAKFITAYVCHSPWKDDTYVADSTMVEWLRNRDGSWEFDYTILDQYVELAMSCGITDAITCYTPLPWQHRVRFLDVETGEYVWENWAPSSPEFRSFWARFLKDLRKHLAERGWFEKTYIGINENPMEDTRAAIKAVQKDSPDWKITYAGNWHPELSELIDDYCVIIDQPLDPEQLKRRKEAGQTTTFYVCCHPGKPNNYPFSPPAENTWMGWHAAAMGYDGFLRWAYDSWTADPLRDTRHVYWPSGDCFMVYPGARSSIRFERLREGISDFEKLRILRERPASPKQLEALTRLEPLLSEFSYGRVQKTPAAETVRRGKKFLDES